LWKTLITFVFTTPMMTLEQYHKLRNTVLYLASKVYDPSKTKLLKLLYLSEEWSIKKRNFPLFGFDFYAWKFGPVQVETWESLNPEVAALPKGGLFSDIIKLEKDGQNLNVIPVADFNDDYFSDNDLKLLDFIVDRYKAASAGDLIAITHKDDALWTRTVKKEEGLLEKFEKGLQSKSNHILDFSEIIEGEKEKATFQDEMQFLKFTNSLNRTA
jgi:uncharacterized phage-associated protein